MVRAWMEMTGPLGIAGRLVLAVAAIYLTSWLITVVVAALADRQERRREAQHRAQVERARRLRAIATATPRVRPIGRRDV